MVILVIVEAPGHELLNDQEDDDGGDVILHGEDIVAVLNVEEGPEDSDDCVGNGYAGVERELGDLSGR